MKNYRLQITVTKDVLRRSMFCGTQSNGNITENCAIAVAANDTFPGATVGCCTLAFKDNKGSLVVLFLPDEATEFIYKFDRLRSNPKARLELPEITFEVDIPDEYINKIDISAIYENHPTLKLIEA